MVHYHFAHWEYTDKLCRAAIIWRARTRTSLREVSLDLLIGDPGWNMAREELHRYMGAMFLVKGMHCENFGSYITSSRIFLFLWIS